MSSRRLTLAGLFLFASACASIPFPASADPIEIAPHRAIYDMSLSRNDQNSELAGASGKMLFEWSDGCDGWIIKQKLILNLAYAEGNTANIKTSMSTWESKDGKSYDFTADRIASGKPDEHFRGVAELSPTGGKAHYTEPANMKDITLAPGTLFPSAHTLLLIERAREQKENIFTRTIFDGSDEEGKSDASAFIGKPQQIDGVDGINSPLTHGRMWPVRLAFFPSDKQADEPDYEMSMNLMENGVAESMLIDYGDFAINAKLQAIEALPLAKCGGKP